MITESEFVGRLAPIFQAELDRPDVRVDMATTKDTLADWDSLAHVRIVVGVENEFGVQLDVEEIETIASVRGFYDAVRKHLA